MSPAIQISNFKPLQVPNQLNDVIKNIIFMRKYKEIKIQKPQLNYTKISGEDLLPNNYSYFRTQQEEQEQKQRKLTIYNRNFISNQTQRNKSKQVKIESQMKISYNQMKRKIIKKVIGQQIDIKKQRQIQKSYNKYLVNSLHRGNLLLIHYKIPPSLSVLETIDDGDYLCQKQPKQYPHYSNVLQPIQLPTPSSRLRIIRQPILFQKQVFNIQDNIVFKIKHVLIFVRRLFQDSIRVCNQIRNINANGDLSVKLQNQNHHFQKFANQIGLSYSTIKLLFDILNNYYDLEAYLNLNKTNDSKNRSRKQLIKLLTQLFQRYQKKRSQIWHSSYIPLYQRYLSLKDLRYIFLQDQN